MSTRQRLCWIILAALALLPAACGGGQGGAFAGDDGLSGQLRCTHDHPQGLGTATGDVTFTASKQ